MWGLCAAVHNRPAGRAAREAGGEDEIECTGQKSWAERDAELRAKAVVLEDDDDEGQESERRAGPDAEQQSSQQVEQQSFQQSEVIVLE